jgi:uncharacterized protein
MTASALQVREIYERPGAPEPLYVPRFEVKLQGSPLPLEVVRDVMQVTYRDAANELDSFTLTINNWDAATRRPKYLGFHGDSSRGGGRGLARLFEPDKDIELRMGYGSRMELMLAGLITTVEPDFPASGPPVLTVAGLNALQRLRRRPHTKAWFGKKDSEVAEEIGRARPSARNPGLGIEVKTDSAAKQKEPQLDVIGMHNQHDIAFLLERARVRGYSLTLEHEQDGGKAFLRFGPPGGSRADAYRLTWGRTLLQFKPTLRSGNQLESVTVRGWNRRTGRPIEGTAQRGQGGIRINEDQDAVAQAVRGRHEEIVGEPMASPAAARARAADILRDRLREMVTGSGETVGIPGLHSGGKLVLTGLGDLFSGLYVVRTATHTIGAGGYRTRFEAHREGPA